MPDAAVQDPETEQTAQAAAEPDRSDLPAPVLERGINKAEWRMLFNLYPGARPDSALMVWDYCKVRRLDPMKKPCHIVPMRVKNTRTGQWEWRDVVMPGIYEYRTTAHRTGLYNGHTEPTYGEEIEFAGVKAPAWCAMTALRWNAKTAKDMQFPVKVYFREVVAIKQDGSANERWSRAPIQMLTKCAEAAALREAFPEEFGGESTAEEREGKDEAPTVTSEPIREPVRRSEKTAAATVANDDIVEGESIGAAVAPGANDVQPTASSNNGGAPAASEKKSPEPAKTAPKEPAPIGQVMKGLRITDTQYVSNKDHPDQKYYEIHADRGEAGKVGATAVFVTKDEQLYKLAESCVGSDTRFDFTWYEAKSETTKRTVRVLTGLQAAN